MKTSRSLPFLLAGLLLAPAAFAADAGEVVLVRNTVRGTPPGGAARPLAVRDGVPLGLVVETGAESAAKMTFDPSGSLTVGARTRVVVDSSVVDAATGRSESALSLLSGQIRLALGRLFRGEVSVDTPTAVAGVKGTDFRVAVDEATGATLVAVTEGTVTVRSKAGGEVVLTAGQRTWVAPGQPPTPPAPIEPRESTLTASAGGPSFAPPAFPETPIAGESGRQGGFFPIGEPGVTFDDPWPPR